jgi:hypothetical protein
VRRNPDAPDRSVSEVGAGDYVLIGSSWEQITYNSATGVEHPREWTIRTEQGEYDMYSIYRYAKAEDMEGGD